MYEPKHLQRWTMPKDYFGETWPEYYGAGFGQHRDSDALTRSNFTCAFAAIAKASSLTDEECEIAPQIVRERHWAVGWVEWIAIHQIDAGALCEADELQAAMESYPVVDESHWSALEWNEAAEYWQSMSVAQRMDAIRHTRCGASIFAARRAELPTDDNGSLLQYLSQP